MQQNYHENPKNWPIPMKYGVLVEVDLGKIKSDAGLYIPGEGIINLMSATVRVLSPKLPKEIKEMLLPDGKGSHGASVLASESNMVYLADPIYTECGMEIPKPEENQKSDLAFVHFERIMGIFRGEDETFLGKIAKDSEGEYKLPFDPLGTRVFFEYDFDDESDGTVELDNGLYAREKDLAIDNQMATVTATGPQVDMLKPGDRVLVSRTCKSVTLSDKNYFYENHEQSIIAVFE